ncbi:MAG: hypothetical protein ABMA13_21765, partial [Chthoniobacteraceae bacterium]
MRLPPNRLFLTCILAIIWCGGAFAQQPVALNAAVRSQIELLQTEKAARSPVQRKMDSRLVHVVKKQRGERLGAGLEGFEAAIAPG